jgi:integrase
MGYVSPDRRRGGYVGRVPVGKLPCRRTKYKEVRAPTHAECVAKMKLVQPPGPDVTVSDMAARWLAGLEVRGSTREGYVRQLESRLLPSLGPFRVCELTVEQVRAALLEWKADGTATANRTLRVGATMLADAVKGGLLRANPFSACRKLKHEPKPLDPFTPAELRAVVAGYEIFAASPLLSFLAATGARAGEACGLDVADYDRATGRVTIRRTYCFVHGERDPKSKHSRRTITVPAAARPAVEYAIGKRKTGPLFVKRTGERYFPGELGRVFDAMLAKLGIRRRNVHAMRHGVATALVSAGVPLGDVAKFLGHTVSQVVRTYVHAAGTDPAETIEKLLT